MKPGFMMKCMGSNPGDKMIRSLINAPIDAGTPYANSLGFTDDLFEGYLWDHADGAIIISLIFSKVEGKGNVRRFISGLLEMGKTVRVPVPSRRMQQILGSMGFEPEPGCECEMFIKRANN